VPGRGTIIILYVRARVKTTLAYGTYSSIDISSRSLFTQYTTLYITYKKQNT